MAQKVCLKPMRTPFGSMHDDESSSGTTLVVVLADAIEESLL